METLKGLKRSNYCSDLRMTDINKEVTLMGWIQKSRNLGGLIFADIRDTSGLCQIVFDINDNKELFLKAEELGSEYVVAIKGTVKERQAKNPNIDTGDIEIIVNELRILNEAETPPIYIKDDDEVSENLRLKYRYLDLRKPKMQHNFKMRHKVCQIVRNFLSDENFLEIETPVLGKPTPEGARDYLVPSRVNPGKFYGLPQSPQLFKQLLMVSGMDKYFQIAKCFRDEDLRADRQPEFTQIDCEMSFVEMDDVMEVMERLMQKIFKETINADIKLPLPRLTYKEAMDRFGSDKPDLRFGFELKNLTDITAACGFSVFESAVASGGSVRAINLNGYESQFTRKNITELENVAKLFGAKGLAWMKITSEGVNSPIAKFMTPEVIDQIKAAMDAKEGDLILFVADKDSIVFNALGHIRIEAAKKLDVIDENEHNFLYVTEFPMFEYDEEASRYVAMHHPFTSPLDEDFDKFETAPETMRAKAYDMVLNGVELGGGSIRIYDTNVQNTMFKVLGFTEEEAYTQFGFLLDAFKYGTPPHGGLAFGLDRIMMLLLNRDSIREVIAFPKNQNAICPLTNAPGEADEKALDELKIAIKK